MTELERKARKELAATGVVVITGTEGEKALNITRLRDQLAGATLAPDKAAELKRVER